MVPLGDSRTAGPGRQVSVWPDSVLLFLAAVTVYACSMDYVLRGDAAMYANYVLLGKYDELTPHVGYYLFLAAARQLVGIPLGIPLDHLMVQVNVVFGALAVVAAYRLAFAFLGGRGAALLCAAIMALSERIIWNATASEIYMMQVAIVLWAFDAFSRDRVLLAGLLGGAALYVSTLSVFAYLFFPALDIERHRRLRWDVMLKLAAAGFLAYAPLLAISGNELLWGRRGILVINEARPLLFVEGYRNIVLYLAKHYTFLVFLLIPGLLGLKQHRALAVCTVAVLVPHLYLAASLPEENGVFLTIMDFFIAAWMVVGWQVLSRKWLARWLPPGLLFGHLALLVVSRTVFSLDPHPLYGEQLREIVKQQVAGQDVVVLSDWDLTMTLTYFGRDAVVGDIEQDPLYSKMRDATGLSSLEGQDRTASAYIVVDPWAPGGLARLLRSDEQLADAYNRHSIKVRAETLLGLVCDRTGDVPHPTYACRRRADSV